MKNKKSKSIKRGRYSKKGGSKKMLTSNNLVETIENKLPHMFLWIIDQTTKPQLMILLQKILKYNNISSFQGNGLAKIVFNINDKPSKVFKLTITNITQAERFLHEPLFMSTNEYCNTPSNINIYGQDITKIPECSFDITINEEQIGNTVVISWIEDKALNTDVQHLSNR